MARLTEDDITIMIDEAIASALSNLRTHQLPMREIQREIEQSWSPQGDTMLNAHSIGIRSLAPVPMARITRRITSQAIADVTVTTVQHDTEEIDTANITDLTVLNTTIRCPVTGHYLVTAHANFEPNGTGVRELMVRRNGTDIPIGDTRAAVTGRDTNLCVSSVVRLNTTDTIDMTVYQDSGGSLDLDFASLTLNYVSM